MNIVLRLAKELAVKEKQINAVIQLLDEGATVPFIARYRKEATGGLDDTQLRLLAERLHYLRELEDRKITILKSIEEQGKLTETLIHDIQEIDNKTALEDLYLPYKPKRRTKAQIAREAGLEPLADLLLQSPNLLPDQTATEYINPQYNIIDSKTALDGARAILIEKFAENAPLIGQLRQKLWQEGLIHSQIIAGKEKDAIKFKDYFDFQEPLCSIPSHRALAILRARNEKLLSLNVKYQTSDTSVIQMNDYEKIIANAFVIENFNRPTDKWLLDTVKLAWRAKIFPSLENEGIHLMKDRADQDAIHVFAKNLKDLLLAAPAGRLITIGLDPGIRTGVKVAIIDDTGKLLETTTIYPHPPKNDWNGSLNILALLIKKYHVQLIAIGNGTASRETDKLVSELLQSLDQANIQKIIVSEAGASVYSASELAATEFPNVDVSLRGAISIARRLQDPLAELVKIDPKSIGVGQYQHDVNQVQLSHGLAAVVEDCVNAVGVDANTASASLLTHISGLNQILAHNIVEYRNQYGAFKNRQALLKVSRLGPKAFEQAAGFLRIYGGNEPLDASAVHPEAYPIVAKMLKSTHQNAQELIGNSTIIKQIKASDFIDQQFGLPTILDILAELEKPGRDPRGTFKTATFAEGIDDIKDLEIGMILEGVVSNVANFGAFIDIGVHQDGLVHISAMSNSYIRNPHEVVKAGDIVKVRVLEVDVNRCRISLSMLLDETPPPQQKSKKLPKQTQQVKNTNSAMAAAFAKLKK